MNWNYGKDYERLTQKYKDLVDQVVNRCDVTGQREELNLPAEKAEIYAYPQPHGGIAWGINGAPYGFCLARDIATKY